VRNKGLSVGRRVIATFRGIVGVVDLHSCHGVGRLSVTGFDRNGLGEQLPVGEAFRWR
jgi:hypothetical protein